VTAELLLFYLLALAMVGTAVAMVLARQVIHAVLLMVANFGLTAVLYLMLQAPFLAMVQLIVYAGAIMVLFLFVVMLLGRAEASRREPLGGQRLLGVSLLALLGALLVFVVAGGVPAGPPGGLPAAELPPVPGGFGSPAAIGQLLYTDYVLLVEIVSVLLLVAMIGAVVIARFRHEVRGIGPATGVEE
jgi:NADH-quinone oxidoreductase subunit J